MPDQPTLQPITNKDLEDFDTLYLNYHEAVFANICKLIRRQEIAEDILQEVFIALWDNRKKIDPDQSVAGWLFVVSYNKSMAHLKKMLREKIVDAELPDIKEEITDNGLFEYQLQLVNTAIDRLPPRKKMAFMMCKLEGKSHEEAASLLGISLYTLKEYLKASSKYVKQYAQDKYAADAILPAYLLLIFLQSL